MNGEERLVSHAQTPYQKKNKRSGHARLRKVVVAEGSYIG